MGGQALIESLRARDIRPGVAIIGEPTMMRVIEGHKGCYEYTTRFSGLAGHGSAPSRGVNAVEYAVRYRPPPAGAQGGVARPRACAQPVRPTLDHDQHRLHQWRCGA